MTFEENEMGIAVATEIVGSKQEALIDADFSWVSSFASSEKYKYPHLVRDGSRWTEVPGIAYDSGYRNIFYTRPSD